MACWEEAQVPLGITSLNVFKYVIDAHHELCALLDQTIRTMRSGPVDRPGTSVKIAALVCGL